jgi:hypothetical protein
MRLKTKSINEWLIVIVLFVGVNYGFSLIRGGAYLLPDTIHYLFNYHPTSHFISIESMDAIDIFRGDEPTGFAVTKTTLSVLFNMVLYFMIGPFLLYMGYKKMSDEKLKPWYWFLGALICLNSLMIVPKAGVSLIVAKNTKESAAKSKTKDIARQELFDVGFALVQYDILEGDIDEDFNLAKLNLQDLKFEYQISEMKGDSLVYLKVSGTEYDDISSTLEINLNDIRKIKIRND